MLSAFLVDLAQPNPDVERSEIRPLIERNPLAFWKWVALLSLFANIALLLYFGSR